MTITIASNAVHAVLQGAPREALLEVHRLLSYKPQGSEHTGAFKAGDWDGRSSLFNWDKARFPAGFVQVVTQGLRKLGYETRLLSKPLPDLLGPERPEVDSFGYVPRYDYQPATVDKLVRHGKIVAQLATGGGKSRVARMAYKRIGRPTLFLTTRGILLHQMKTAVEAMGEEVAVLGDGEWGIPYTKADGTPGRRITPFVVATVQTLAARLEKKNAEGEYRALQLRRAKDLQKQLDALKVKLKKGGMKPADIGDALTRHHEAFEAALPPRADDMVVMRQRAARHEHLREVTLKVLERFEFVIAEEAHEVSGDGFFNVMNACRNAHYRLALTATPFMKDDEEANMRLLATCGPVAIRVTEQLLIERGVLARPYFKFLRLSEPLKPKMLYRSTPWQRAYEVGVVNNEHRNKLLCAEVLRALKYGLNSMVLVQHKAHGELLREILARAGARTEFIFGENNQEQRQRYLSMLGTGALDVLIGSTILDVGVDVPSVGMIVLAGGGKAEVATRQRIGRGLREKKSGPNSALIVDVWDEFNNHLAGHAAERREIITGTPGFENVVTEFDYAALGFTRKS